MKRIADILIERELRLMEQEPEEIEEPESPDEGEEEDNIRELDPFIPVRPEELGKGESLFFDVVKTFRSGGFRGIEDDVIELEQSGKTYWISGGTSASGVRVELENFNDLLRKEYIARVNN